MNVQLVMEAVQISVPIQVALTAVDVLTGSRLDWMVELVKVKYFTDNTLDPIAGCSPLISLVVCFVVHHYTMLNSCIKWYTTFHKEARMGYNMFFQPIRSLLI